MATLSSSKGSPDDEHGSDDTNQKDTSSANYMQDDDDDQFTFRSRKSYPQRNNRSKLNYRDLERGVYDAHEFRQSIWALGGPLSSTKNDRNGKNSISAEYSDDEDVDDETPGDDDNEKSNDDAEQMHRRLWCICKKPWDHSRLMLRCDSCANWYHGDCIGVTKEQARVLDMNGDQFVCPPCQKVATTSGTKPERSSDESMVIKRKRIESVLPSDRRVGERNGSFATGKNLTHSEPSKRPKTGIFFHRNSSIEPQIHCIVHGCSNWAKSGWVYCSTACIRRHINETLQTIQRSKGANNDNPPSREDILLYENRSKKVLDRKLVPKVEDLCTWINQHPSYEIVKPALRQSILLTANESKSSPPIGLIRSSSTVAPKTPTTISSTTPKLSWVPLTPNTKSVPIKKAPVQLGKQPTPSNVQNYGDIRMKVPQALADKLIMRLEKSGEKLFSNEEIHVVVDKIEEEMYRVYGKVDNSYKNKFRSLLANISNMNNNFFYKHILSKEVTAKQVVAMKPEDMLPPEEKEKRKDEFEKEVQMIIKANEQTAEEMARRARTKITRQGLVDNDVVLPAKELSSTEQKTSEHKESKVQSERENYPTPKLISKTKKPLTPTTDQKSAVKTETKVQTSTSNEDTASSHGRHTFDINCSICANPIATKPASIATEIPPPLVVPPIEKPFNEPPIREESNPSVSAIDFDNDYIEPESPTGIDALLYDDDDDLNNTTTHSRSATTQSPSDNHDYLPPTQPTIRDDYNPLAASKRKTESTFMYQPTAAPRSSASTRQWRGIILPPDAKLPCQSVRTYGESDYLIGDIPEQLAILGRLRLGDLWDYIRDSLAVRDVIILSLISSNNNENNVFSGYVETMRTSGRAAVINKRTEPSSIRDMYVLAADSKDCPSSVVSTLSLVNFDPKQLFLVIIGTGKRTNKSSIRASESQSSSHLIYKPVALQDPIARRDPRLLRSRDPRSGASDSAEAIPPVTHKKDALVKSTAESSKTNEREDLFKRFSTETAVVSTDNLNEENMEVDEEQDDKYKKQLMISEFNDVDYRFLDQDMDHRTSTIIPDNEGRKDVFGKSSFSDVMSSDRDADDRTIKSTFMGEGRERRDKDSDFRASDARRTSPR